MVSLAKMTSATFAQKDNKIKVGQTASSVFLVQNWENDENL